MLRNLILGGLLTLGLLATTGAASAQYVVRGGYPHGGHHHGGYGRGAVFYPQPVVVAPPRPVVVSGYPWGTFGSPYFAPTFGSPTFISPSPTFISPSPYYYGGSFGTVGLGYYRPGFGVNLGFVIR